MLLERQQPDMHEIRDTVKDIVADTKRASEVMWQLRAFLRKQDTNLRRLDLNSLIEDVLGVLNSDMVIHHVRVVKDLAADLPQIMGDDVQLKQVLINLILNAQQAMEGCGVSMPKLIIHTSVAVTGQITVGVEDSGPGIEKNLLEQIFEPFYTTRKDGTGMGLAISRFIIEAHGGRMRAENRAEGGAIVGFSLQVAEGSPES
jgi:two-component system sensor kinase FixL